MKKLTILLLFAFSIHINAQKLPNATFYSSKNKNVEVQFKEDNTYKIVAEKGDYTIKNDTIYFYKSSYAKFNVVFKKNNTPTKWIKLNFSKIDKKYHRIKYQLYYGITYEGKLDFYPVNFTEDFITTEIPRKTKVLHLVSKLQTQASYYNDDKSTKIIEQYQIPENVTEIDINYNNSSTIDDRFKAIYLADTKQLIVQNEDTLSLQKPVKKNYEKALSRVVKTDWNPNKEYKTTEKIVNIHNSGSLKKELKQLKKTNKVLIVFHYPEDASALEKYNKILTDFKESIEPKSHLSLPYTFYFTDIKKDKKTLEQLEIPNKNHLFVINAEKEILLEKYQLSKNIFENFFYENEFLKDVKQFKTASDFDKAIMQKNVSLQKLTDLFFKIIESKTKLNLLYYNKLRKSTPKDVKNQWERLINSHENTAFNFDYYALLAYYFSLKDSYSDLLENERNTLNKTDFKAINYLFKFIKEAKNTDTFIQQKRYFNNNFLMQVKSDIFSSKKSQKEYPLQYDAIFLKLLQIEASVTNYHQYFEFLKRVNPSKYLQVFGKFSEKYFSPNVSVFESLNSYYETIEEHRLRTTWNNFKNSISNFFNEASWLIVTDYFSDKETVQLGIKWSETSLKIEPKNPYYLDTLAHLYYINGDKEKGIKTLEEVIKISKATGKAYEHSIEFKRALISMKNGTYTPPKKQ